MLARRSRRWRYHNNNSIYDSHYHLRYIVYPITLRMQLHQGQSFSFSKSSGNSACISARSVCIPASSSPAVWALESKDSMDRDFTPYMFGGNAKRSEISFEPTCSALNRLNVWWNFQVLEFTTNQFLVQNKLVTNNRLTYHPLINQYWFQEHL